ncbi:MAG TPA: hypothetical protein VE987_10710 [Polyangiaceae bacterium]|nr:hypothetical protein [Polyangiaceae bacterium]
MPEAKNRTSRGLPAIARAREERSGGRVRWTTQAGMLAASAVLAGLIAHGVVADRELKKGRQALLAKQRAVAATLGAEWYPLRDKLEGDVLAAAAGFSGDMVDPQARRRELRSQPGLYLRMRVADARDAAAIHAAAAESRKDAFAACLLREPNERGVRGEIDGGAFPEQPWNLGRAYEATRILTDDWTRTVAAADDDLRLRAFTEQYDKAVRDEIPLAIDVVKRAQFFLLVLDEDVPEAAALSDSGAPTEAALQLVAHPARVHLFALPGGQELLRLRRSGEGRVIPAGERVVTDQETREAMQRQANNCALAAAVEQELSAPATARASRP